MQADSVSTSVNTMKNATVTKDLGIFVSSFFCPIFLLTGWLMICSQG
jgi:hypothetical protein